MAAMNPLQDGDDLAALMGRMPYLPTQKEVSAALVNDYAAAIIAGTWDWNRTETDPRSPMIVDPHNAIVAGHHRFVAAALAQVVIPEGVIKLLPAATARPTRPWSQVTVRAGYRP